MKSAVWKVILILMLVTSASLFAADTSASLVAGIEQFGDNDFSTALRSFRDVILDPSVEDDHPEAYYWIARSYLALSDLPNASKSLEFFLMNYPEHALYADAYYQKGRLLFLQKEYEKSIRVLYDFIERFPDNQYISNGYFWIGECLFSLGALEDAQRVFKLIPEKFPSSFKVEAATYRISLIELKKREEVLLDMIQMSHEEYIKVLEDFQTRERTYKQALDVYQRKLADAATADKDGTIYTLRTELSAREKDVNRLEERIVDLNTEIANLRQRLADTTSDLAATEEALQGASSRVSTPVAPAPRVSGTGDEQLIELKARVLDIKEYYLNWLTSEMEVAE